MAWTRAIALIACMLLSGGPSTAVAEMQCSSPDQAGVRRCTAGLSADLVQRIRVEQQKSQWCWAASLEMVFARYGHVVPQAEIVDRWFGAERDLPLWTRDILKLVEQDWFDAEGNGFSAVAERQSVARPTLAGFRHLLQTLADEHPLLLVTSRHVVVLVELHFEQYADSTALRITGGTVLDPLPSQGLRSLTEEEARPVMLARVQIRPRPLHFTSVTELGVPSQKAAPLVAPQEETAHGRGVSFGVPSAPRKRQVR